MQLFMYGISTDGFVCFIQREQLRDHENMVQRLETELEQHKKHPPERGAKQLVQHNFKEKDNYLRYEVNTRIKGLKLKFKAIENVRET